MVLHTSHIQSFHHTISLSSPHHIVPLQQNIKLFSGGVVDTNGEKASSSSNGRGHLNQNHASGDHDNARSGATSLVSAPLLYQFGARNLIRNPDGDDSTHHNNASKPATNTTTGAASARNHTQKTAMSSRTVSLLDPKRRNMDSSSSATPSASTTPSSRRHIVKLSRRSGTASSKSRVSKKRNRDPVMKGRKQRRDAVVSNASSLTRDSSASLILPENSSSLSDTIAYTPIYTNKLFVTRAFAGIESVWYLTENGEYHGKGRNRFNELGKLKNGMCSLMLRGSTIRKLSIGRVHTIGLLYTNSCYVTGSNLEGQLCTRHCAGMSPDWQNIDNILLKGNWRGAHGNESGGNKLIVDDVFAVWDSSFFVLRSTTTETEATTWILLAAGSNRYGQCALGYRSDAVFEPGRVIQWSSELQPVKITGGSQHILILDNEGSVWGCGSSADGQLGEMVSAEDDEHVVLNLQCFECFTEDVKDVACGDRHSVFLTESGKLFVCGYNGNHACGIPDKRRIWTPTQIELKHSIERITCGWDFTVVLDSEGILLGCGKAHGGALGPTTESVSNVLDQEDNEGVEPKSHTINRRVFPQFRPINFPFHKAKTIDFVGSKNYLLVVKDSSYLIAQEKQLQEDMLRDADS